MILRRLTEQLSSPQRFQAGLGMHHVDQKVLQGAVGFPGMSQKALIVPLFGVV